MAKRFIDTKMWDKSWYRKLSPEAKLLWVYILTKCDHAGILDGDWEAASFFIGYNISEYEEIPPEIKNKMIPIDDDQYFIPSFVDYQYGLLKENSKPHLSVIKRLENKGLNKYINRVSLTPKDKDKVKDKEKDIEKRKDKWEKTLWNYVNNDANFIYNKIPMFEKHIEEFIEYWTEPNRSNTKMKFEMQETFNNHLRLRKWFKNVEEWNLKGKEKNERREMQFTGSTTLR
tara:strand:+ start:1668 stop:2357 length:690 start_codon:yes stop_codon:yes gene_type:complete